MIIGSNNGILRLNYDTNFIDCLEPGTRQGLLINVLNVNELLPVRIAYILNAKGKLVTVSIDPATGRVFHWDALLGVWCYIN